MVSTRLKELLEKQHVSYRSIAHSEAYDAQRTAQAAHVPGREFAKTVVVRADGKLCMAVLPAMDQVDLDCLRQSLGAHEVALADEEEIRRAFPDCDLGAQPPFGELYGMEVFVSPHLRQDERIAFNGGSHDEAIVMQYADYERLAHPNVLRF